MPAPKPFRIIPCTEWGARAPKSPAVKVGRPHRSIFHHTAGHVPNLAPGETYAEAVAYARAIQRFHMDTRGWNDSGHNFLVTRGGYILEGRRGSLDAVNEGRMVISAHCVGQNDQPGVELEHNGNEPMTVIQREAAVWLFARIAKRCGFAASMIYGHRQFNSTECPSDVLYAVLPQFRRDVNAALQPPPPKRPDYLVVVDGVSTRVKYPSRVARASALVAKAIAAGKAVTIRPV